MEKTLESPLDSKEIKPVNPKGTLNKSILNTYWKDWCWSSNTLTTWWEELTHWKRPWSWERLKAGWEGDNRGWDGWMASLTRWTWVEANSETHWNIQARDDEDVDLNYGNGDKKANFFLIADKKITWTWLNMVIRKGEESEKVPGFLASAPGSLAVSSSELRTMKIVTSF